MRGFLRLLILERVVVTVILINAAALTASGFYPEGSTERTWFDAVDYACVVYFLVEVILKISFLGPRDYFSTTWNRFDFAVTVLCLPVLLDPFLASADHLGWAPIFRTGRLFRLFRLLRFIPNIDHLLLGVRRALRASVGVFLALFLVNLITALTATYFFGEHSPERFGNPALSFYSIFQIFTIEGWHEFPSGLEEGRATDSPWLFGTRIFFMASVLLGGILGFSLANAVFLDEMTMDNNRELERKVDRLTEEIKLLQERLGKTGDRGV